jgi:hypothetical protein
VLINDDNHGVNEQFAVVIQWSVVSLTLPAVLVFAQYH